MYSISFDNLKIGMDFETATGTWSVWDKGERSLLAWKYPFDPERLADEQLEVFFVYDFPISSS